MQAQDSKFAIRLLPSLGDFAFLMPMVFLFVRMEGLKTLLGDCDTGWHIRTGQWIAANRTVPVVDLFSYSKPHGVWYAWEWLSDLIFAGLYQRGGLAAVSFLAVLLLAGTFFLLFRLALRKSNAVLALAALLLAVPASSIHFLARPHLFTLFFTVVFYGILDRVRAGNSKMLGVPALALLPAITVVWTNLHGGFFVGIALTMAYGAGELLTWLLSSDAEKKQAARLAFRGYALCAIGCLAASLLNPYTYHLHQHVFEYLADPYLSQHIAEFLSMSFHHPVALFFEAMLGAAACAAYWNFSRARYTEAVLLAMWIHASLLAARNVPIFMLVATPLVAEAAAAAVAALANSQAANWTRRAARQFNRVAAELTATEAIGRWHLASFAGVALVAALLFAPHPPAKFRGEFSAEQFPVAAVRFLGDTSADRIFTFDQWGDYLIYARYPKTKVFIDGRSDFYGDDLEEKILGVLNVKYGWQEVLKGFGVDTILLPPSSPLTGALKESREWRVVYDDGIALVFRSTRTAAGQKVSIAGNGEGESRDREVTKTQPRDRAITKDKTT